MNQTAPPEAFRLAVGDSEWWFLVSIAPSVRTMKAWMRKHVGGCDPKQLACVVGVEGYEELAGCVGFIFLPRTHLGAGLVAHELAHAAFRVFDVNRLRVRHWQRTRLHGKRHARKLSACASEEMYCHVLEQLTKDFWIQAHDRGYA